ncbi:hypothetical protein F443_17235 [Phytophthora nicotianae P1569]|uniref:ABC-transporter extension domain-containing protein n=1 Tax=Phytophthora nicotianae P1569 TaxID=1317065 RepID=V9EF46_PHYNI|nr:hypothetical protein F443_17235 [Phytophthora nicotianae P1569]
MPSILWLKNYLLSMEKVLGSTLTIVLVSHDRFFLNEVAEETILVRGQDKKLVYFDGNYDSYEEAMDTKKLFNERLQHKLDRKTEKMTKMVARIAQQASKGKDDKKSKLQLRRRKRWSGLETSATTRGTALNGAATGKASILHCLTVQKTLHFTKLRTTARPGKR